MKRSKKESTATSKGNQSKTRATPEGSGQMTAAKDAPMEKDRRGEPLPARQRVGGIITPQ
jgi:hypothetical protein